VNTCNCASGKDRTGMHVQNALNYAALMRDRMEGRMGDLKYEQMSPQDQIKHLDAHHFDVLEAAEKSTSSDKQTAPFTDFATCLKKGVDINADDLAPFLRGGVKELNLDKGILPNSEKKGRVSLHSELSRIHASLSIRSLSEQDLKILGDFKKILFYTDSVSLSENDAFREAATQLLQTKLESSTGSPINLDTTWEMIAALSSSEADKAELQALQARNRAFMLETGQHEVQEWNTGSPGYKLYSGWPANLVTRGGQTEKYFMRMFGLTADEVAEWVTMQAKYNDT
jgi:hypothetical protein